MTVTYVNDGDLATPENFNAWLNRAASDIISVKAFGAEGDGVTDDTPAFQLALDAAASGGVVWAPEGTYALAAPLTVSSGTRILLSPATVLKRTGNTTYMIGNEESSQGVYADASDIMIEGGTWDANGELFDTEMAIFAFIHIDRLTLKGARFTNVPGFHHGEIVACRDVVVRDCVFDDYVGATTRSMLQLDQARNSTSFPFFDASFDGTPNANVLITGCTFRNGQRAIESHFTSGDPNINLRITGNHFEDITTGTTIIITAAEQVIIEDNTFKGCERGVLLIDNVVHGDADGVVVARDDFVISHNVFRDLQSISASYAIRVESGITNPNLNRNGIVSHNVVSNSSRHGIVGIFNYGWTFQGNVVRNCGTEGEAGFGITLDGGQRCNVVGNNVSGCVYAGIRLTRSPSNIVSSNLAWLNHREGMVIDDASNDCVVSNNFIEHNSSASSLSWSGIFLSDGVDRCSVQGNVVRGAISHRHGIHIGDATCSDNFVTNNDLLSASSGTVFVDEGTSTNTTAGNRLV